VPPDVSLIVVSHNTRVHLDRCLTELGSGHEVIVVDTGSTDGSQELVRDRFPHARLLSPAGNPGYGGASNAGIALASGQHLVVMNADTWPLPQAVERLVEFADGEPSAGVVGPRLRNPDGTLQPSVRGFPTLWRLATEYLFLRHLAPRSRALNAFYGSGFDHSSRREVHDFLTQTPGAWDKITAALTNVGKLQAEGLAITSDINTGTLVLESTFTFENDGEESPSM